MSPHSPTPRENAPYTTITPPPAVPPARRLYSARFADSPVEPLFPFGFGLCYTEFEYSDFEVKASDGKIETSVKVKNVGKREGKEVVQLYVSDLVAERVRPVKELKNFAKITLAPGETKTVRLDIKNEQLEYYHRNMEKKADSGDFLVQIGHDSAHLLCQKVYLEF